MSQNTNLCYAQGMRHFLKHLLTPQYTNNQRAKLLHNSSLFLIVCLLLISSFAIGIIKTNSHSVLGLTANISAQDLLTLTNQARQANGLGPLALNNQLAQAAAGKAEDMFTNNYWAHISPSGVTPWDFIRGAGYNYQYAGENLARGYGSANDAMNAWMASPEHRANILSSNYTDVGFAVAEGNLTGDTGTVLIVEEFGKPVSTQQTVNVPVIQQAAAQTVQAEASPTAIPTPTYVPKPSITAKPTSYPQMLAGVTEKPLIDSKKATQTIGIALLILLIIIFILDMMLMGRRKVMRIVGHNLDHIIFFATIILIAILLGQGVVF